MGDNCQRGKPRPVAFMVMSKQDSTVFREQITKISEFQAQVRALRLLRDKAERQTKVRQLRDQLNNIAHDG